MFNKDEYVKRQEELQAQFLVATADERRAIASAMQIAYLYKEQQIAQPDDKLSQSNNPGGIITTPMANKFKDDPRPFHGCSVITIPDPDFRNPECWTTETGEKIDQKVLDILMRPESLAKLAFVASIVEERAVREEATKLGYDVKKVGKAYELTPNASLECDESALMDRVQFIQNDAKTIKNTNEQSISPPVMSPLPETSAHGESIHLTGIPEQDNDDEASNTRNLK